MLIEQADVLCVKNLSKVCDFRTGCGLLPNPVLLAILYGLRICTPKYLHTVSLNWTDIEDEEVSTRKLPISIKFEPISSYIAVNLFIEPSFSEKKNSGCSGIEALRAVEEQPLAFVQKYWRLAITPEKS